VKLTATQSDLSRLLRTVAPAVGASSSHPVLGCVLLLAEAGKLSAQTYNLDTGITAHCVAAVDTAGSICLPHRLLAGIIDRLDDSEAVTISADGTLSAVSGTYQLPPTPAEDFPDLPAIITKGQPLTLGAAARAALLCASTDASKAVLQGIHLANGHVAATDGHRLVRWPLALPDGLAVTLPAATVKLIGDQPAVIATDKAFASICLPDSTIHSRIIDGTYPAVAQLIPKAFEHVITCDRHRLQRALERVALIAEAHNNVVKLSISDGIMAVTADADGRNGREVMAVDGPDCHWAFNVRYLLDGLKVHREADQVTINGNSPTTPVVLKSDKVDAIYLVMPVQVRE
jgi:DNA polymerase-3 subunit beta